MKEYHRHRTDPAPAIAFRIDTDRPRGEQLEKQYATVVQWTTHQDLFYNPAPRTADNFYPLSVSDAATWSAYNRVVARLPHHVWQRFTVDDSVRYVYLRTGAGAVADPSDASWSWGPVERYVVNHDPVASAGEPQVGLVSNGAVDTDVVLDGSGTTDVDPGSSLDFVWTVQDFPTIHPDDDAARAFVDALYRQLSGTSGPQITAFSAGTPVPPTATGVYRFEVSVTDDDPESFYGTRGRGTATTTVHLGNINTGTGIRIVSPTSERPAFERGPGSDDDVEIQYVVDHGLDQELRSKYGRHYQLRLRILKHDDPSQTERYSDVTRGPPAQSGSFNWSLYTGWRPIEPGLYDLELTIMDDHWTEASVDGYSTRTTAEQAVYVNPFGYWADLVSFRPSATVQQAARAAPVNGHVHRLEDAASSVINLDYYPVRITQLPILGGRQVTPEELLETIRTTFNQHIKTRYSWFEAYEADSNPVWNAANEQRWLAADHLAAIISIDLLGPDNASVISSLDGSDRWRFSTIYSEEDGGHPVTGNREWGIDANDDGSFTFYTRAADRPTGDFDDFLSIGGFTIAHWLWQSLQDGVAAFVNANGGSATTRYPMSNQPPWHRVRDAVYDPQGAWLP